jgi:hypothetical protein
MALKYTKEITDRLVADYQSGVAVETLAEGLDVPPRPVIAKLSSLGVYQRKQYRDKLGNPVVLKERLLEDLAALLAVPVDRLESLEKATKPVLKLLIERLESTREQKH